MDISTIISKSRIQTNTSTAQKNDSNMLADLNTIQDNIFSVLWSSDKRYAWTNWTGDLVANQSEYAQPLEDLVNNYPGMRRLLKIFINYWKWLKKATIYSELPDFSNIHYDTENPIAVQRDWSFFFYPTPSQNLVDWFVVEWTYRPLPLSLSDTSEDIKLAPEYHDILLCWLNKSNYEDKQLRQEAQMREQKYEVKLAKMIEQWAMDYDWPYEEDNNKFNALANSVL